MYWLMKRLRPDQRTRAHFSNAHTSPPHYLASFQEFLWDFPDGSDGKASAYNAGDPGSVPGLGRSPGEGNGNPLQYSCLKNPIDGGVW